MRKKTASLMMSMILGMFLLFTGSAAVSPQVALAAEEKMAVTAASTDLEDGEYSIDVTLEGGSGRSAIASPAVLLIKEGCAYAQIRWSSSNYDYMKVGEEKFLPLNKEGNSVFEIPVPVFDEPITVIGDTTAMSTPHEVEYKLTFSEASISAGTAAAAAEEKEQVSEAQAQDNSNILSQRDTEISPDLKYESSMELLYAQEFAVDYYQDGYALITMADDSRFLVVPEKMEAPENLDENIVVLKKPVENIYLVASAVMDMFVSLDALDTVRFSALEADAWYIDAAKEAMEEEKILYAGKYSAPDYERILAEKCGLAVENTMIYHTPEVAEQLEKFGIPVLVDHSSYEKEPLGRTEWVKLYGLLTGQEDKAEKAFSAEMQAFDSVKNGEKTGKTVAFFYITNNGEVNVRRTSDYLPKMIELAGGKYIFENLGNENSTSSTMTMQMEEFYAAAKEADYIIYNSTIDGELSSVEEMTAKSQLLSNFKAVKEGNVYCTTKNLYQSSMELGTIITDIHSMLKGEEEALTFLYKLE